MQLEKFAGLTGRQIERATRTMLRWAGHGLVDESKAAAMLPVLLRGLAAENVSRPTTGHPEAPGQLDGLEQALTARFGRGPGLLEGPSFEARAEGLVQEANAALERYEGRRLDDTALDALRSLVSDVEGLQAEVKVEVDRAEAAQRARLFPGITFDGQQHLVLSRPWAEQLHDVQAEARAQGRPIGLITPQGKAVVVHPDRPICDVLEQEKRYERADASRPRLGLAEVRQRLGRMMQSELHQRRLEAAYARPPRPTRQLIAELARDNPKAKAMPYAYPGFRKLVQADEIRRFLLVLAEDLVAGGHAPSKLRVLAAVQENVDDHTVLRGTEDTWRRVAETLRPELEAK